MVANLSEVLNGNLDIAKEFSDAVEGKNVEVETKKALGSLFVEAMKAANENNITDPENVGLKVIDAKGGVHYYTATIKEGSYEDGHISFDVETIDRKEYEALDKYSNIKMVYDANVHEFEISLLDEDENPVLFKTNKLEAGLGGFVIQGTQAYLGGTLDMEGVMIDTSDKVEWDIKLGSDKYYNTEYMEMTRTGRGGGR